MIITSEAAAGREVKDNIAMPIRPPWGTYIELTEGLIAFVR